MGEPLWHKVQSMVFSQLVVVPLWMFGATTASWFTVK
jgi:hypothetical protein